MCEHKWSKFPENKPRYLICTKCGEVKESITNLEKWKKERIEKIEKLDIEGVVETILDDVYSKCEWCVHHIPNTTGCPFVTCHKSVKAWLEKEFIE